jgi:hypothetical protein
MTKRPLPRDDDEIDRTLSGRLISALGSLFFSLPLCALVGILFRGMVPMPFWLWPIGLLAFLGFIFPKAFPEIIAGLLKLIFDIANSWKFW